MVTTISEKINASASLFTNGVSYGTITNSMGRILRSQWIRDADITLLMIACCVVMASKGYPQHYEKGFPLEIPETIADQVYVAGAALKNGVLVTNGGRVVGCTAVAETLPEAIEGAYALASQVHFENSTCRRDIGQRALRAVKEG